MKLLLTGMLTAIFLITFADNANAKKAKDKKVEKQKVTKKTAKIKPMKIYHIKRKALPVLTLDQLAQLNHYQRVRYVMQMRRAYELAEVMTKKLKYKSRSKSAQNEGYENELWALLLGSDKAFAANFPSTEFCIYAGNLIRRTNGECNIINYDGNKDGKPDYYNPNTKSLICNPTTGLRGKYAFIPYSDEMGRPYAPHVTYATCAGRAQAIASAFTTGTKDPLINLDVNLADQITSEQISDYQQAIENYRAYLRTPEGKKVDEASLAKRRELMVPLKDLAMIPEVEAHQIKLAADYKNVRGKYPAELDYINNLVDVKSFDKLAVQQKVIDQLSSNRKPTKEDLISLGFSEERAQQILDEKVSGRELLSKYFNISPEDGVYSTYDKKASGIDDMYFNMINYCVGKADVKNSLQALNKTHQVGCKNNPRVKECIQYLECEQVFKESGGQLTGGRLKDVMDEYKKIVGNMTDVCNSLPPDGRGAYPVCVLGNEPLPRAEPVPPVVVVPPPPPPAPPKPRVLARNPYSFGCSRNNPYHETDVIAQSPAACAVCSLEADAKVYEELDSEDTRYTSSGVSQKWLTLLNIMGKACGEGKSQPMNVMSIINYAQVFGHCSAATYSWNPPPYDQNYDFVTFLQDRNTDFTQATPQNFQWARNAGWKAPEDKDDQEESYHKFINDKFKEIFGFHYQRPAKKKSGFSFFGSSDSSKDSYGNGLKEMFCGDEDKKRKEASELLGRNFSKYETTSNAESAYMNKDIRECIQEGIQFAKKHYHKAITQRNACYKSSRRKPTSGNIETAAPIVISQQQWKCGFSTELYPPRGKEPELIQFYRPNTQREGQTETFVSMFAATPESQKNCGFNCDDVGMETDFIVQNQCLVKELSAVPGSAPTGNGNSGSNKEVK